MGKKREPVIQGLTLTLKNPRGEDAAEFLDLDMLKKVAGTDCIISTLSVTVPLTLERFQYYLELHNKFSVLADLDDRGQNGAEALDDMPTLADDNLMPRSSIITPTISIAFSLATSFVRSAKNGRYVCFFEYMLSFSTRALTAVYCSARM